MDTFFIRHTDRLDIDQTTRDLLWNNHKIAIHYPDDKAGKLRKEDNKNLSPEDYSGSGRMYMRILAALAAEGGYVCADYYQHPECVLGYVEPGAKIELFEGKWGNLNKQKGRTAILKCLSLDKVKLVSPADLAVTFAARPRQGTIMRWWRAGKVIESIVEGKTNRPSFDLLSPDQQEVMCSEFLRLPEAERLGLSKLVHLVLPVGRTLKAFDIYGITAAGGRVFGQVTYHKFSDCSEKLQSLLEYKGRGNELVLFCDCSEPQQKDGVFIVPIRYVYEQFTATPSGKQWLRTASSVASRTGT